MSENKPEIARINVQIDDQLREKLKLLEMSLNENVTEIVRRAIGTAHWVEAERKKKFFPFAEGIPLDIPKQPRKQSNRISHTSIFSCFVNHDTYAALLSLENLFPTFSESDVLGWCVDCFEIIQSAHDRGEELRMVSATGKVTLFWSDKRGI
jgi:hypothetical protein